MNNFENSADELDCICDKVRFAISVGDELDDEMNKHLEECQECRTFLEQSMAMEEAFKSAGCGIFAKNGMTVADSVMEEVRRQEVFTKGMPAKTGKKQFRHMGLIAACAVIAVMAFPLVKNGILGSKDMAAESIVEDSNAKQFNQDAPVLFKSVSDSTAHLSAGGSVDVEAEEESADYEAERAVTEDILDGALTDVGDEAPMNVMLMAAPPSSSKSVVADGYDSAENGGSVMQSDTVYHAEAYENEEYAVAVESVPTEKNANDDYATAKPENENAVYYGFGDWRLDTDNKVFDNAEDAAVYGALRYCDGTAVVLTDNVSITYTDDGEAYAVFDISDGSEITVYLKEVSGTWKVVDVCDGDITE